MKQIEIGDRVIFPDGEAFFVESFLDIDGDEVSEVDFAISVLVKSACNRWTTVEISELEYNPHGAC